MEIISKLYKDTLCVSLKGELDENTAIQTRTELDKLFDEVKFNQVVFDFGYLDFIDSTGIGVLIGRYKKLSNSNKQGYIVNPSPHAEKIFIMSGIYKIMPKIE